MEASEGAKDRARMRILQRLRLVDVWGLPDRLGMPFSTRLSTVFGAAFVGGFALGGAHGSAMAGYRYRAENAHRFPTNNKGWYLYHKSKNYHMTVGAVKSGIKLGARLGVWSGLFIVVEGAWDHLRNGTADAFSSMMAGLTIAGTYSLKSKAISLAPIARSWC